MHLVQQNGPLNWVTIAQIIGSRSPKQCRERYHQNLKPSLVHEPITADEGALIEVLVGIHGKKWADIARRLNGRSDNAVKNWWNGSLNRRRRLNDTSKRPEGRGETGDERQQQQQQHDQSYARRHQPLTLGSQSNFSNHRIIDNPLPSPVNSEASRIDSAPPSLVSDNENSPYSRAHNSPPLELPPLILPQSRGRRPSLPMLQLNAPTLHADVEAHSSSYHTRYLQEQKPSRRGHYFHPYARPERPELPEARQEPVYSHPPQAYPPPSYATAPSYRRPQQQLRRAYPQSPPRVESERQYESYRPRSAQPYESVATYAPTQPRPTSSYMPKRAQKAAARRVPEPSRPLP